MTPDSKPNETRPQPNKMTKFLCQELLFDFVMGHLDESRQKAVDEFLVTCRESQRELERLRKGFEYCHFASQTQVGPEMQTALFSFEPLWQKILTKATLWSSTRGWSLLPYVFLFTLITVGLLATKPWRPDHKPNQILLAEQEPPKKQVVSPAAVAAVSAPAATAVAAPKPATTEKDLRAAEDKVESSSPPGQKGLLTRGELEVSGFDLAWPAIRDKIRALNGKVAGNVELGWQRRPGEAYFHFTLPESNKTELDVFLKTFGPVRFSTDAHPRVMPAGQIRIILTVKDGIGNESPAETESATETP